MSSQVKIRFNKLGHKFFFKDRKYEVTVNGSMIGHLASNTPELNISLPEGNHSCEIREIAYSDKKDFNLKTNQLQTLTIIPTVQEKYPTRKLIGATIYCIVLLYFIIDDSALLIPLAMVLIIFGIVMHFLMKRLPDGKPFEIELDK